MTPAVTFTTFALTATSLPLSAARSAKSSATVLAFAPSAFGTLTSGASGGPPAACPCWAAICSRSLSGESARPQAGGRRPSGAGAAAAPEARRPGPARTPKTILSNVRFSVLLWKPSIAMAFVTVTVSPLAIFVLLTAAHTSPEAVLRRMYV